MLGATAGRTTLNGEGLQHEDGHSPRCSPRSFPASAPTTRPTPTSWPSIIRDGIERMYGRGEDVYYYVTLYNENYPMPPRPDGVTDERIVRGHLPALAAGAGRWAEPRRNGARPARRQRLDPAAGRGRAAICSPSVGIAAEVYSATSFQQLRARRPRGGPLEPAPPRPSRRACRTSPRCWRRTAARSWSSRTGSGRSRTWSPAGCPAAPDRPRHRRLRPRDTREALRRLFEIDAPNIAAAAAEGWPGPATARRGRRPRSRCSGSTRKPSIRWRCREARALFGRRRGLLRQAEFRRPGRRSSGARAGLRRQASALADGATALGRNGSRRGQFAVAGRLSHLRRPAVVSVVRLRSPAGAAAPARSAPRP